MSVIRLRIMGGLGNQLFQYAAARYVQERYGINDLVIESKEYQTYRIRNLEIFKFALPGFVIETQETKQLENIIRNAYRIYQKVYLICHRQFAPSQELTIGKTRYICSTTEFKCPKVKNGQDVFMNGYFVSADIAQEIKGVLFKEIVLLDRDGANYKLYQNLIENSMSVGISIRCGDDYVKAGWPICSKEYYLSGLKLIKEQFPNCRVFVFSDNIDKVRNGHWFEDNDHVVFVENVDVCESFDLLRMCKHYVCANSSFSWWGAFLTHSRSPIIIEPNIFYAEQYKDTERLRYKGVKYLHYQSGAEIS